jgi:transposase
MRVCWLIVEGRRPGEVAATYGVARSWVYDLVARWRTEGDAPFEPRSRRPKTSPATTLAATGELIVEYRQRLTAQGLDAGSDTIGWHLDQHHHIRVSRATIDRTLRRQGLVVAAPKKRPRSSYIRFEAERPNEMWQSDFTHYRLTTLVDVEILSWLDDHSRHAPVGHRPPPGHGHQRARHVPRRREQARSTGVDTDRQRDGVHPNPDAGSGRPGCLETSPRADEGNRTPVFSLGIGQGRSPTRVDFASSQLRGLIRAGRYWSVSLIPISLWHGSGTAVAWVCRGRRGTAGSQHAITLQMQQISHSAWVRSPIGAACRSAGNYHRATRRFDA